MKGWTQADLDRINAKNSRNASKKAATVQTQGEGRKTGGKGAKIKPNARIKTDYSKYDFIIGIDTGVNTGFCYIFIVTQHMWQIVYRLPHLFYQFFFHIFLIISELSFKSLVIVKVEIPTYRHPVSADLFFWATLLSA